MGKWVLFLAAAAAATAACMPGSHCSEGYDCPRPDPCYPTGTYHCEGETVVFSGSACGQPTESRHDCAATGQVCTAGSGACATACSSDAACPADQYCAPLPANASSADAVCAPRLQKGADCTQAPGACVAGLVCDAAPSGNGKTCRADCAMSDKTAPRCPDGAKVACIGSTSYRCDECGVGTVVIRECSTAPDGAHACIVAGDEAFCAVSTDRDPRCANVDSYCDGDVIVDCFQGYATARADCAPQHCVENGARCGS